MENKEVKPMLCDILARGRAAGILACISTQRPSAEVIPGLMKQNISAVCGLRCHNRINSDVAIGEGGLERLEGNGHGIFMPGRVEFQAPFLSIEKARELVAPTYVDKPGNVIKYEGVK
jgi:S-DNA-T family DNA segregation ATPase FtsK/SpoIIIE